MRHIGSQPGYVWIVCRIPGTVTVSVGTPLCSYGQTAGYEAQRLALNPNIPTALPAIGALLAIARAGTKFAIQVDQTSNMKEFIQQICRGERETTGYEPFDFISTGGWLTAKQQVWLSTAQV